MGRHKGGISPSEIDRLWPYQVALHADEVKGWRYRYIHAFCTDLSLAPRGHSVVRDRQIYIVFCFADPAHADLFRVQFNGEHFDPAWRGRGKSRCTWLDPKPKIYGRGH